MFTWSNKKNVHMYASRKGFVKLYIKFSLLYVLHLGVLLVGVTSCCCCCCSSCCSSLLPQASFANFSSRRQKTMDLLHERTTARTHEPASLWEPLLSV